MFWSYVDVSDKEHDWFLNNKFLIWYINDCWFASIKKIYINTFYLLYLGFFILLFAPRSKNNQKTPRSLLNFLNGRKHKQIRLHVFSLPKNVNAHLFISRILFVLFIALFIDYLLRCCFFYNKKQTKCINHQSKIFVLP